MNSLAMKTSQTILLALSTFQTLYLSLHAFLLFICDIYNGAQTQTPLGAWPPICEECLLDNYNNTVASMLIARPPW